MTATGREPLPTDRQTYVSGRSLSPRLGYVYPGKAVRRDANGVPYGLTGYFRDDM